MHRRNFLQAGGSVASVSILGCAGTQSATNPWASARRAVFLGDSITYAGGYVDFVQTWLLLQRGNDGLEFINLGLPSETVSGLSEPGHAGGKFPRPDLHERLDRVLAATEPDIVVACYGMNCGIYHPLSDGRFARYRDGIGWLRERARRFDAQVLHITPPVFDPEPIRAKVLPAGLSEYPQPFEGYNEVLDRYSAWLVGQRDRGWQVVNSHEPMNRFLSAKRNLDPGYRLANDGVHLNETGHWLVAREVIGHLGGREFAPQEAPGGLLDSHPNGRPIHVAVQKRQRILKDAWLTATGHKRPGMKTGLPLAEARRQADVIGAEIENLLRQ